MIASVEEMIDLYVQAWNGKSLAEFKAGFAVCWAEDSTYTDPNFALISGVDGIAGLAQSSLDLYPIRTFSVLTAPDYHHNVGLYSWTVDLPEHTRDGYDYFEFNEQNQITRLVSFFEPLKQK
jgi:hypothetical protein